MPESQELLKTQQIDAIVANNWSKFDKWVSETGAHQTFDLPQDVADVLIPKKILELSDDPTSVGVLLKGTSKDHLGIILYERTSNPLSDPKKIEEWQNNRKSNLLPNSVEDSPEGVDYMHLRFNYELGSGRLTLNDRVYIQYFADIPENFPYVAETRNYTDRKEFNGQGIGTSFYNNWEAVLKRLGFRYLVGSIISPHPGFFRKTRTNYDELPASVKAELPPIYAIHVTGENFNRHMVRTL